MGKRRHRVLVVQRQKGGRTPQQANMPLLAVPYRPSWVEHLILSNRNILADQMEFLVNHLPKNRPHCRADAASIARAMDLAAADRAMTDSASRRPPPHYARPLVDAMQLRVPCATLLARASWRPARCFRS